MTTLRALLYADYRSTINQIASIRRSPARALVWLLFTLIILFGIGLRVVRAIHHGRLPYEAFSPLVTTDAIVCLLVFGFGSTLALGSRMAGLFAHPAEARFIIGSPATPFVATIYIQTRRIVVSSFQRAVALLYGILVYLPDRLSAAAFARDLIVILAAATLIAAVPLARQLLDTRLVLPAKTAGFFIAALAVVPVARDAAVAFSPDPPLGPALLALPAWHPGALLLGGPAVQYALIAALCAVVGAIFAFVARRAHDAYPELYELSMSRLQRTERLRNRVFGTSRSAAIARTRSEARTRGSTPAGIAIFVWRAWTEYRRTNSERSTAIETGLFLIAGYAAARFTAGHAMRFVSIATTLSTLLFIVALARAAALATELRRPLFWLSPATLFERLCALAIAHCWRIIGWFVLAAIGLAAGRAPLAIVAATLVAGPAAVLLAVAIGYASYALLPNEIDQRGPMMFLRVILGYVFALPVIAAGIITGLIVHAALIAIGVAIATAFLEAAALIGFASWRLDHVSIPLR